MKKRVLLCLSLMLAVMLFCAGIVTAFAETEAPVVTDPAPVVTDAPVQSEVLDPSEPFGTTSPSYETTAATEVTTDAPEPTEIVTMPTEYNEDAPPSTNSSYYATDSNYDVPEYKGTEAQWGEIDEKDVISLKNENSGGAMSFGTMKDVSEGDEHDYTLIIIGIVLVVISVVGMVFFVLTFVDKSKLAPAHSSAAKDGRQPRRKDGTHHTRTTSASGARVPDPEARAARRRRDDFNDGY